MPLNSNVVGDDAPTFRFRPTATTRDSPLLLLFLLLPTAFIVFDYIASDGYELQCEVDYIMDIKQLFLVFFVAAEICFEQCVRQHRVSFY